MNRGTTLEFHSRASVDLNDEAARLSTGQTREGNRMKKLRVLFVCVHNSARSQMAEAWTNALFGDRIEAESAGLEPGTLNPLIVRSMSEVGIDISNKRTKSVFDLVKAGRLYSHVITVCDQASAERCPIFTGVTRRLHWSFPDPAQLDGTDDEKREAIAWIRDEIRKQVEAWVGALEM